MYRLSYRCEINETGICYVNKSSIVTFRDTSLSTMAEVPSRFHFAAHMGQLISGIEGQGCHNFYPTCPLPGISVLNMMKKVRLHWSSQLSESTITEPVILRILSFCSRSRDYYIIKIIIIKDYNITRIQFVQYDESRLGDATYKRCMSFRDNVNYWGKKLMFRNVWKILFRS